MIFSIAFLAMSFLLPPDHSISSIYGSISPADAGKKVLAIRGFDTVTVVPESGIFSIAVTAGTWKLYVKAQKPYLDELVENIRVEEGRSTNVGLIRLRAENE